MTGDEPVRRACRRPLEDKPGMAWSRGPRICGRVAVDTDAEGQPRCAVHRGADAATAKRQAAARDRWYGRC